MILWSLGVKTIVKEKFQVKQTATRYSIILASPLLANQVSFLILFFFSIFLRFDSIL